MDGHMRKGILVCCLVSVFSSVQAQTEPAQPAIYQVDSSLIQTGTVTPQIVTPQPAPKITAPRPAVIRPKRPAPNNNEWSMGFQLNTDGWGLKFDRGVSLYDDAKNSDKFYDIRLFQVEFSEHKHPKEHKENYPNQLISDQEKTKPYIFGKINNFYALKLGYGFRKMIAGKPEQGTVSIHWVYAGGLSIGLLKPYYIDALVPATPSGGAITKKSIKYTDGYEDYFTDKSRIIGNAGWTKGLGNIKVAPGIHAKTGLHFDFAASPKSKMAIETGLAAELYTQKIQLMVDQKSYPYLICGYIAVQFGKRW